MMRISWRRVLVVFVLSVWIRGPRGTSRANAQEGGRGDDEPAASRTVPSGSDGADPSDGAPALSDDRDRRGDEERRAIADDPVSTDDAEYRETAAGAVADDESVHRDGADDESASRDHQRMWGAAGSTTAAAGSAGSAEGAGGSAAASEDVAAPAPTAGGDEHRHPRAFDTAKHHFPPERQEHRHQHTNGDSINAPKVRQDEGAKHPHTGSGEGIREAGTAPDDIPANATTAFAPEDARQRPTAAPQEDDDDEATATRATGAPASGTKMAATKAFVVSPTKKPGSNKSPLREPPEGYVLSARVYIDPNDRLAHFDPAPLRIPYWDCGYAGSTTSPLPLRDAYFRHAITGATSSWTGTDGRHAVLAVALAPLAMDLNSGESREFAAGDVILMEDVLLPGHKIRPLQSNHGVSILFLTLPGQHTHTGKDRIALPPSLLRRRVDPCPNDHPEGEVTPELDDRFRHSTIGNDGKINMAPFLGGTKTRSVGGSSSTEPTDTAASARSAVDAASFTWTSRRVRRFVFSVIGLSLSSLAADFLGKTAPLWLAVGVGGTCFVVGGTWAVASLGDALWTGIEIFVERRKLKVPMNHETSIVTDDEDEDKDKQ